MPPVSGQTVLIIGGSTGIGFSVAKACLAEKMTVHIASSNADKIANAAERLKQSRPEGKVTSHVCKLGGSDDEEVLKRTLDAATQNGKLDHIIFTAGDAHAAPLSEVTQPILESASSVRFVSKVLLGKLAPSYLNPHWTSSLIFTGGAVADKPVKGYTYNAFYAGGLHPLVRALAVELAPIRVNCVAPGATATELWGEMKDVIQANVEKTALLGKAGSPEEVAEAYGYLMRDTNATGMAVKTDGGFTCW